MLSTIVEIHGHTLEYVGTGPSFLIMWILGTPMMAQAIRFLPSLGKSWLDRRPWPQLGPGSDTADIGRVT